MLLRVYFCVTKFNVTYIMHDTMSRLLHAAKVLRNIDEPFQKAKVARLLNESPQTLYGWSMRGVSNRGLFKAQDIIGCDATWIKTGNGSMCGTSDVGVDAVQNPTLIPYTPEGPLPEGAILIPVYRLCLSAGYGELPEYELVEEGEPVPYLISWFQQERLNPKHVKRFKVVGDSMEPLLFAGDSVLVDLSDNDPGNIVDGKVYAIRHGASLKIKKLSRKFDGTLVLRSENKDYEPEEISPRAADEVVILGRVRDRSGSGGL